MKTGKFIGQLAFNLSLVFTILKLANFINWSWFLVLSPSIFVILGGIILIFIGFILIKVGMYLENRSPTLER